ncbi:hypothetical protein B0I31_105196 [Saccharothrix carnea]|uniref:Uncharacterized protein n=1 Tax=Saccharothrix carnea TaxID=1280637 RepID=A0A2P8I9W9_SACCR|nr:hypothetical protein [Saccharothrix carnea]PSL55237.1 hypothetical protein B0I31_105196 [Saccharothrix carnea]
MDEFWLRLTPLFAIIAVLFGLGYWWNSRRGRREEQAHVDGLAALATTVGGRVVDPAAARPWSVGLLEPMRAETDGLVNRLSMASPRSFGITLDFPRGRWSVRVGEASVEKSVQNGTRTDYEHRIEVSTARLTPMKISRRVHGGKNLWGRPLPADHISAQGGELVREVPVTVAAEGGQWHRVAFPPGPFDAQFAVFTSDPAAVARAFDPEVVEYLVARAHSLPSPLHFEAGLVFGTMPGRISPALVLDTVDVILGLLDRMGVTPAHPPVTA